MATNSRGGYRNAHHLRGFATDSVAHCASAGKEFSAGRHRPLSAAGVIYRWRKRDPFQVDDRAYSLSCRADFREFLQKVLAWEAA